MSLLLPCRGSPNLQQGSNASRWFSALLLQDSFAHIGSTLLLFAAVADPLERRYGTWRILLLALIAGVAGNFFSASVEVCPMTHLHMLPQWVWHAETGGRVEGMFCNLNQRIVTSACGGVCTNRI